MKTKLPGSKLINNWLGMFIILAVFIIDTALGNVYKVIGSSDYVTQVYQYVSFKEMFGLIPYILLVLMTLNLKIKFDKFDIAVLFTCLILQMLNCADFFLNNNWRPMWTDWVIFLSATIPAIIFKFLTYTK